ncbi:MAG: hypothetical protein NZ920_03310 [Aigarchaeota archaeon]|nr:hypothetical protein [Aigarchaeota archaeon]MDW8092353.1 hypothetical protein [Nitrososphaerota archaeon]
MKVVDARWVAGVAMLSAIAYAISILRLNAPYPILPFLSFDFSEVADLLAYMFFGLKGGLVATFAHWMALNMGTPFHRLVGPTMKLLAVVLMMVGIEAFRRVMKRRAAHLDVLGGIVFRVGGMAMATFVLYYALFPEVYLPFAQAQLSRLGFTFEEPIALVSVMVAFNALFNLIHVPLSYVPATAIEKAVIRVVPYIRRRETMREVRGG